MQTISVQELKKKLATGPEGMILIDVREPFEYKSESIPDAQNVPREQLDEAIAKLKGAGTVYVHCNTGNRSGQACELLNKQGVNVVNVQGGLSAWKEAGFETEGSGGAISIIRQMMIGAGTLILIGVLLGFYLNPWWYALCAFVGCGLLFGGVTGKCGMTYVLRRMPWNR